jgi:hypothetical protein
MAGKRKARIAYYEGVKEALAEHMRTTETGIRDLPRLSATEKDKLVASVRKHHAKLLKQVDQNLAIEMSEESRAAST